jgi:hypothetical protein
MKSELENTMLKPAILALIRQILTVAGTALVAKGVVQASDVEPVIGALLTIGSGALVARVLETSSRNARKVRR